MAFEDRQDAGRRLAVRLAGCRSDDVVVLGLPRGGVPVAFEVALALDAPLDVIIVRKLGVPVQPELAMGALGEDGVRVLNDEVIDLARISDDELGVVEQRNRPRSSAAHATSEGIGLACRWKDGRSSSSTTASPPDRPPGPRAWSLGRTVPGALVLAVPVAPPTAAVELRDSADDVVVLETPARFFAIGQWYRDFGQTPDREVTDLLDRAADR